MSPLPSLSHRPLAVSASFLRSRLRRAAGVAVAITLSAVGPRTVRAQPTPKDVAAPPPRPASPDSSPGPAVQVTPPRPLGSTQVPYPEGGTGSTEVVLALLIDLEGAVREVEVERGEEPFASAAKLAATRWRFVPATRNGAAVAARIRFAVAFVEEPPPEPGAAESDGASAPPAAAPAPATSAELPVGVQALEVRVVGEKLPPSVSSLKRTEVRELPGAFGDPFRAIEILPGVTPIVSGLPFFYVRGAPPGNVGYFLDGVRVPYLFHAAAGPSVIHPGLVDRVDLYSGGYPARYGRFAGAIVAAETTTPRTDWHGEGNVRLVDVGALVEGGFDGGRGTALVGGRYSYTAAVFSLISPEITLDYRDYQARVTYDVTSRDRLTLFAFGAYDLLTQETNDIETILFGSEFYRVDTRYDVQLRGGGTMRAAVTWGFDQTRVADQRNARDMLVGTRLEVTRPLGDDVVARGGFDVQLDDYEADDRPYADPDDPETKAYNELFPPRFDGAAAAHADVVWQVDPAIEVTPGVRLDTFRSNGVSAAAVDPRLAVTVDVADGVRVLHALGTAHQPPSFIVPVPGLAVASLRGGLQRSLQAASGVELELPYDITATITAFNSVFLNMSDTIGVRPPGDDDTQLPRSLGTGRGLEVYIRRSLAKRLGGFVSYTLSRSTRTIDGYTFPTAFDRTHVLNTALAYDLGHAWRMGARFSMYSGTPVLEVPNGLPETYRPSSPPRDPTFYRLDLRLAKKWQLGDTTWISFVLEMLNATLNTETINGQEIGPVSIPSIGAEGGF
jgi:hypothetical protein